MGSIKSIGSSNVGDADPVTSTRVGGRKIEELSKVEQMRARGPMQLTAEQQKRKEILERYEPMVRKMRPEFLEADVRRAEENIARFQAKIEEERRTIIERQQVIPLCRQRDQELKLAGVFVG